MSTGRAIGCHYCPPRVAVVWLSVGLLAMLLTGACRRSIPVVDHSAKPTESRGTLTGLVRGPEGTSPVAGRDVQIINTDTGARHTAQTATNGGFTIQLPPAKYRIELRLKDGETLVRRPGIVDLANGDSDSPIEFVLGAVRASRPRGPAYRLDNGLGSPIT